LEHWSCRRRIRSSSERRGEAPGGGVQRLSANLAEHLYLCQRVIVVPRNDITKLGPGLWTGAAFRVYSPTTKYQFQLENGKKTYKLYRDWVNAYRDGRPMPVG
jgi:hypothetical protein